MLCGRMESGLEDALSIQEADSHDAFSQLDGASPYPEPHLTALLPHTYGRAGDPNAARRRGG